MLENGKIKTAQMIGSVFEGGVESCIMNYFSAIDTSKVTFDFYVDRASKIIDREKIEALGGRVIVTPHYTHIFKYIKFVREHFKSEAYDIVHANMTSLNFIPLSIAKKCEVKVRISHAHSTSNGKEKLHDLIKKTLRPFSKVGATDLFACSEKAARWLYGDKEYEKGEVYIVNNAIDLSRFRYSDEVRSRVREKLGIGEKTLVLGHIGRFCEQKNHKFLLDVFSCVKEKHKDSKLILVGEGPLFEETKAYAESKGLSGDVLFLGSSRTPEIYYSAMDAFVLPSLYEGLPIVAVEAQANGLCCFFSDEVTKEAKLLETTRYLSLEDGKEKWTDAILHIKDDVDREYGYSVLSKSKYSISNEAKRLLCRYEELLIREKR